MVDIKTTTHQAIKEPQRPEVFGAKPAPKVAPTLLYNNRLFFHLYRHDDPFGSAASYTIDSSHDCVAVISVAEMIKPPAALLDGQRTVSHTIDQVIRPIN